MSEHDETEKGVDLEKADFFAKKLASLIFDLPPEIVKTAISSEPNKQTLVAFENAIMDEFPVVFAALEAHACCPFHAILAVVINLHRLKISELRRNIEGEKLQS